MKNTDSERLDFLEKWEVSIYDRTRFTLLTQHVSKDKCQTLRDFCDYGIDFEKMLDSNSLDAVNWHYLPHHLQKMVEDLWQRLERPLNKEEKEYLEQKNTEYWEDLAKKTEDPKDK
jgi:hypothetical protein